MSLSLQEAATQVEDKDKEMGMRFTGLTDPGVAISPRICRNTCSERKHAQNTLRFYLRHYMIFFVAYHTMTFFHLFSTYFDFFQNMTSFVTTATTFTNTTTTTASRFDSYQMFVACVSVLVSSGLCKYRRSSGSLDRRQRHLHQHQTLVHHF